MHTQAAKIRSGWELTSLHRNFIGPYFMCLIAAMFLSRLLRRFSPWFLSFSFRFVSFSLVPQVQELEERYFDIANLRFNAINENPHAFRFDIGTLESTQQIRTTRSANNTHRFHSNICLCTNIIFCLNFHSNRDRFSYLFRNVFWVFRLFLGFLCIICLELGAA